MSRVYFHSPSGEAELRGSERAWMASLCDGVALGLLNNMIRSGDIARHLSPDAYPLRLCDPTRKWNQPSEFVEQVGTYLRVGSDATLRIGEEAVNAWVLRLNTAIVLGDDALRLCARLHGQCEIHAWVNGPNRAWLAGIIDAGLEQKIFRRDAGWEGVATFLRSNAEEPVVTSYSVCDQFPNSGVAQDGGTWAPPEGDEDGDSWYDLSSEERWRLAFDALKAGVGEWLEMRPDHWESYRFTPCLTVFDLLAEKAT